MEAFGGVWLIIPIFVAFAAVIKYLFWLLLIGLAFSSNKSHINKLLPIVFIGIQVVMFMIHNHDYKTAPSGFLFFHYCVGIFIFIVYAMLLFKLNKKSAEKKSKLTK